MGCYQGLGAFTARVFVPPRRPTCLSATVFFFFAAAARFLDPDVPVLFVATGVLLHPSDEWFEQPLVAGLHIPHAVAALSQ